VKFKILSIMFYILVAQAVQCLTTGWTIGRSRFDPRQGQRIFLLAPGSRPALGPTQHPIQWVPAVLSPVVKRGRGVTLTPHPHLVPSLRMSRSYTSCPPHVPPWHVAGQLYFLFYFYNSFAHGKKYIS
jgi:hypothetical protein